MLRLTKANLARLEDIFAQSDFVLRYEKGNFKSGYCVLKSQNVIVVNKYYALEGKISCLTTILNRLDMDFSKLNDESRKLLESIKED